MSTAHQGPVSLKWLAEVPAEAVRAAFVACSTDQEARYSLDKLQARPAWLHVGMV